MAVLHKLITEKRKLRLTRTKYQKRLKMSLRQWLIYHQKNIHYAQCKWMGVRALKNPFDAWIYQEIIYEVKPDVIVEIGSAEGGSTLYFANLLDILRKGRVISVDIDRTKYKIKHKRIITVTGNSSSPGIISKVTKFCKGKSVLIIHDADHSKNQVLNDLNNYSPLVSIDSYFIVEDSIVDLFKPGVDFGDYREGPLAAVEEFLDKNNNFVADNKRERYILTYNPMGFLKRIR